LRPQVEVIWRLVRQLPDNVPVIRRRVQLVQPGDAVVVRFVECSPVFGLNRALDCAQVSLVKGLQLARHLGASLRADAEQVADVVQLVMRQFPVAAFGRIVQNSVPLTDLRHPPSQPWLHRSDLVNHQFPMLGSAGDRMFIRHFHPHRTRLYFNQSVR